MQEISETIRIARSVIEQCVPGTVDREVESIVQSGCGVVFYTVSMHPESGNDYAVSMTGVAPGRIVKIKPTRYPQAADGSYRVRIVHLDDDDQGGFKEIASSLGKGQK